MYELSEDDSEERSDFSDTDFDEAVLLSDNRILSDVEEEIIGFSSVREEANDIPIIIVAVTNMKAVSIAARNLFSSFGFISNDAERVPV